MEKMIVKNHWLPFSAVKARASIENLILESAIFSAEDLPAAHGLSNKQIQYVIEKSAQVAGQPARLLSLLEDSGISLDRPPDGDLELWQERIFLKAFALSRLERTAEAAVLFTALPAKRFQQRIDGERALYKANHGDFEGAVAMYRAALQPSEFPLDPFSACTMFGGLAFASIQQGDFKVSKTCLDRRREILRSHPSTALAFGTQLYEILLLFERNDFERADEQLRSAMANQSLESVNGFFLLHLKLRLHIMRNELAIAETSLVSLKALADRLKLPEGVLDFRLEEIELRMRSKKAATVIEALANLAKSRRDEYLNFRLSMIQAQAALQAGHPDQALSEIEKTVRQGESRGYRPGLTWAFFHAAGIALAAGKPVQARLFLNRGRKLARELGLKARAACFSYMSEVLDHRYASASALIALAKHQDIGPELEYFLDGYQLLESVKLVATSFDAQEEVAEPKLRRMLFVEPGVFWFQKEGVLIANRRRGKVASVDLSSQPMLIGIFRLFWSSLQKRQAGLKLSDIHHVKSDVVYREDLHASSAKMLVSRLREKIKSCGITIMYDRQTSLYQLVAAENPFTIRSSTDKDSGSRARGQELLERIAMEPFVSTKTLCAEFGITRQALHPFLNDLVKNGRIRVVRRGPRSGYMLRN